MTTPQGWTPTRFNHFNQHKDREIGVGVHATIELDTEFGTWTWYCYATWSAQASGSAKDLYDAIHLSSQMATKMLELAP